MPINKQKLTPKELSYFVEKIGAIFSNVFDNEDEKIDLDPRTAQGQLIAQLATAMYTIDCEIVDKINGTNIFSSQGLQTDKICNNFNIFRKNRRNVECICNLTGVEGTIVPTGSLAKDIKGNIYTSKEDIVIKNNVGSGIFVAEDTNNAPLKNTITTIVSLVDGWETVNNNENGIQANAGETSSQLIRKYYNSTVKNSVSVVNAIKSSLINIYDIEDCIVKENDTDEEKIINNFAIPKRSLSVIILGGSNEDIFDVLYKKKAPCIPYNGDITSEVEDVKLAFYRPITTDIFINIEISIDNTFPSDGMDEIIDNIFNYYAENSIGQDIVYSRMYSPINNVIGHDVKKLEIGKTLDTLNTVDINIHLNEIAIIDKDNIKIKVVE